MNSHRRRFIQQCTLAGLAVAGYRLLPREIVFSPSLESNQQDIATLDSENPAAPVGDNAIRDQLDRVRHFDIAYHEDRYLTGNEMSLLNQVVAHLERVRKLVGHGNFALLSFDDMLRYARNYPAVGKFSQTELDFFDQIFHEDAAIYGFLGDKVLTRLTSRISDRDTVKVPYTGNYLYRNESLKLYQRLQKDVGEELVLTSGIRGVVKQMYLFLAKAERTNGNLSQASRSLAPPGYSYHGIGDFDVGKRNFGSANFTERFASTEVFDRLVELGYVDIRYTSDNQLGVRYEPWHIKVV